MQHSGWLEVDNVAGSVRDLCNTMEFFREWEEEVEIRKKLPEDDKGRLYGGFLP